MMALLPNLSDKKIVVIGDVMLDVYLVGEVNRISPDAPVPVVWVKEKTATLGGAGNVALNLAGLGCRVTLVGMRGNDAHGKQMSDIIRSKDIFDGLVIDRDLPTTTKNRIIVQRQQIIRFDEEDTHEYEANQRNLLKERIKKAIATANGVILSDYNKGVLTGDICQFIIALCKAKDIPVFVDPKRKSWERYHGATCITPNIAEIEEISGSKIGRDEKALLEKVQELKSLYDFKWFLATRGADGMCLIGPDYEPLFIRSMAREVFDVSGAGDTVIATLAAAVLVGLPFPVASEISNVGAGIVVGKVGSQPITIKELDAAWKNKDAGRVGMNKSKIFTLDSARLQIKYWKTMNEHIVMTHGCFDLIHPGHIHTLSNAKDMGDRLVVGLYSDPFIKRHNCGTRPILNQLERAEVLSSLQCIDMVVMLDERDPFSLLSDLNPDMLVNGTDDLLNVALENHGVLKSGNCKIEDAAISVPGHHTTSLINKMLINYQEGEI